ncbi:Lysophospholipase L1 [Geodermatophilus pulveris]|uniref:Lysophospholipase L1 n=1 Tax=Geodermatophilus pulveris TaxID=1564159 RepID=A0A239J2Z7_9ACTN|nr:SGNH/GDSL hydrolase family protein [Geodermatophilus pulveris]SNS99034.1 Lysophospholipase L1 [Geodermatophilus pulveris]
MTVRVVSLGDSTSCGEGVGVRVPADRTWPSLLARGVPDAELTCLAVAGARLRELRAGQLAPAVAAAPHLATLLVGLNDIARGGFCGRSFARDLAVVVQALRGVGATVLLGRLHDPCRLLPLPAPVRGAVLRRVAEVNGAVDRLAVLPGVHVLDLAAVPGVQERRSWDVDRLHPAAELHGRIARTAAEVLQRAGLGLELPPVPPLPAGGPSVVREALWAARHGAPWLVGHLRGVTATALELART